MQDTVKAAISACSDASDTGSIRFPQVVETLMAIGVERYHVDLVRARKHFFMPDGANLETPGLLPRMAPAVPFDPVGVQAAIRASQGGEIDYPAFCDRVAAAGCVGYLVTLAGRRAIYFGRTGDLHVEHFPKAA